MNRKILVTSALPYANGPIHIGHLVEYIQTDIWVRYQKLAGNKCLYFCADDTHGTPIMLGARKRGITPEQLIESVHKEHLKDFNDFQIEFANYYTTHSTENKELSSLIYNKLKEAGSITSREIEHSYCNSCEMFLPDRFIRGDCPVCGAEEQYGDSCDKCGATYRPEELGNTKCALCGEKPTTKKTTHYFFKLGDYEPQLRKLLKEGHTHSSVSNKLDEWFDKGLRDWDISRDGPYFGFKIPGEQDKYFYVWLDAPVGYMASVKNYCDAHGMDFNEVWNGDDWELYHFIGKDIMYFHALFWPAMLIGAGFKTANKLFVHGFLTVDGAKMSKSKGTFIKARSYINHLDPQYLRYYYAAKLGDSVEDIDLSLTDFVNRVNSDLVGKLANLASRSVPMLRKKLDGKLAADMDEEGKNLVERIRGVKDQIAADYEALRYGAVIRQISSFADEVNRYVDNKQPWVTVKTDAETTRATLTAVLNAVKLLTTYIKPVLPEMAKKVEKILAVSPLTLANTDNNLPQGHIINDFERLIERVDMEKINAMIEEEKAQAEQQPQPAEKYSLDEPLAEECDFNDFMKVDLRVAKVIEAKPVEGADKLLQLTLDIGGIKKNVFAGISKAYKPEDLNGRLVVCVANLKPRKMRFGVSEGMVIASGPGGEDVFLLSPDSGAQPGQRVH